MKLDSRIIEKAVITQFAAPNGTQTRETIRDLRLQHPDWTLARIGEEVGISRERVRQVLKAAGLPTSSRSARPARYCLYCGKKLDAQHLRFCNRLCWAEQKKRDCWLELPCPACGRTVRVAASIWRYRMKRGARFFFCDRFCRGRWTAARMKESRALGSE